VTAFSQTVRTRQHQGSAAPISRFRTTTIGSHRTTPISALHVLALVISRVYHAALTASLSQTLTLRRQVALLRSLSQTETLALSRQLGLVRGLSQAQSLVLSRRPNLVRGLTQAQSLSLLRTFGKVVGITQPQTVSLIQQARLIRASSQAQALVLIRLVRLVRALAQSQSLSISVQKVILRTLSVTQPQSLRLVRDAILSVQQVQAALPVGWHVPVSRLTLSTSISQLLGLSFHKQNYYLTLSVTQAQVASPDVGIYLMGPERTFLAGYRTRRFVVADRLTKLRFSVPVRSRRFGVRASGPHLFTPIGPLQRRRGPPSTPMIRRR
jgi:hypothetical protein